MSKSRPPAAGLSIGGLAGRTGVPRATLRSWEARYGAPRPQRGEGGHRRYAESDVALVGEILRQRDAGLGLPRAVERAVSVAQRPVPSVFAGLRARHGHLRAQTLRKRTLVALSRAIEDECCARAQRPVLFAAFQREAFYRSSEPRWIELARTAEQVVVFADFPASQGSGSPVKVRVPDGTPLRREWLLVCDAPDYPACVAAWEVPGSEQGPDADRRFEAVWSVEPGVVRDASRICAGLADAFAPELRVPGPERLASPAPPASADLRAAMGLFDRVVQYVDAAS